MQNDKRSGGDRLSDFRKLIHRQIAFRELEAQITSPNGAQPVIAVGEHEFVSDVMVQAERTDGYANLFVLMDDGRVIGASVLPQVSAITAEVAEALEEPVHRDSEVGLLVAAAENCADGLNFRLALPSHTGEVRDAKELDMVP